MNNVYKRESTLRRLYQTVQFGERIEQGCWICCRFCRTTAITRLRVFPVLVVVAVKAQQFPITAVRWIIVVVVVFVVDRQLLQPRPRKFTPATCANMRQDFQRPFAIAQGPDRSLAPQVRQDPPTRFVRQRFLCGVAAESGLHAGVSFRRKT